MESLLTKLLVRLYMKEDNIELIKTKIQIAQEALNDIINWNEDLEDEWEDPGYRARAAIEKIKMLDGFEE